MSSCDRDEEGPLVQVVLKDVLEPLLSRIATFLAAPSHTRNKQGERDRVSLKEIIAFCDTCKETYAAKTDLVIAAFELAAKAGDALSISLLLRQPCWVENRIREAGLTALLTMMQIPPSGLPPTIGSEEFPCGCDEIENECIRIAACEHGAIAAVACMMVGSVQLHKHVLWILSLFLATAIFP
jgi:hypothetical protein